MKLSNLRYPAFILFASILFSACTLRIGSSTKASGAPAPTTVPLSETAQPSQASGLVPPKNPVTLPMGFAIGVFSDQLDGPRMLALSPDEQLYAAERGANRVVRLPDRDGNGRADGVEVVADRLDAPSSLAFYKDGSLYVAETTQVVRLSEPDGQGVFSRREVIIGDLPEGGHSTRTVLFSPDFEWLFVSIGSSCNVCEEKDSRRAAIMRYRPDGSEGEVFARGLRNAVGITFRPGTQELWATNNGRDMLGDDLPPETVYQVQEDTDYGWPRCHSGRIPDPEFGGSQACRGVGAPAVEMQAHSAPLGLTFYSGQAFPEEYAEIYSWPSMAPGTECTYRV
jgi:glucose/arabinose dehydrogenase